MTYADVHATETDRIAMASSCDIGTGRIPDFFSGGRPDVAAATVTLRVATMDVTGKHPTRAEVEQLVATTDPEAQMRMFGMWGRWLGRQRGRR